MAPGSMISLLVWAGAVVAQFPPTPEGVREVLSKFHPGVSISYKETSVCETTPGVKSYAGYVRLPVEALNETFEHNGYPINTFYWFFESRKDPENAPLAIWLNGGPGGSSLMGALAENGPCFVHNDSKTTYLNPWSWNNEVNLLYIDQPNQVGFSYDIMTNVTVDLTDYSTRTADFSDGVPAQNTTFLVGTTSSQKVHNTANTTAHAATAIWHFAQTWFEEFPQYKPHDERISLFTESYGGRYGPAFMSYFQRQNELISNGTISAPGSHYLHLATLGIINGCIEAEDMYDSVVEFAYNNTYGIQAITQEQYERGMHDLHRDGGVFDRVAECRRLADKTDPSNHGDVAATNKYCSDVGDELERVTEEVFVKNGNNARFDITHEKQDPFPTSFHIGWLNQPEIQKDLGVPVNHSWYSSAVAEAFGRTGDICKGGQLEDLAYLLDSGVNVALFHGDRDYACNWIGGERYSVKIPWSSQKEFAKAGYTPLSLAYPYTQSGGLTRQHGNLSFTRVYQSGHMIPSYQPEVAYNIFMRALNHKDIATGEIDLREYAHREAKEYSTSGPGDTWWMKSDVLAPPPHTCYTLDATSKCSEEEIESLKDGSAIVEDWILKGQKENEAPQQPPFIDTLQRQHPLMGDW